MTEKVKISFEASYENDASPFVVVLNPSVLPLALLSQVARFGVVGASDRKIALSGKLKGNREGFTQMIQSYGLEVEIVRVALQDGAYISEPSLSTRHAKLML